MIRGAWWSARGLEQALSGFFHRPVTVQSLRYSFTPLQVDVDGIRVGGLKPDDRPFLEVPHALAVPDLARLWERRVVLSRLRVDAPVIRVDSDNPRF